jgi:hypothetical protein
VLAETGAGGMGGSRWRRMKRWDAVAIKTLAPHMRKTPCCARGA